MNLLFKLLLLCLCFSALPLTAQELSSTSLPESKTIVVEDQVMLNQDGPVVEDIILVGKFVDDDPVTTLFASNQEFSQGGGPVNDDPEPEEPVSFVQKIINWAKINLAETLLALLAIAKIVVNLTPTEKDNSVLAWIESLFNSIFPNLRKGGGVHQPPSA